MTRKNITLISIASVASLTTLGVVFFIGWRKHMKKQQRILDRIADEGYETAHDILYPLKKSSIRKIY
ncbi:hypothetical protein BH10BAC3_BH10BAC3_42590 [soil metagenome]